MELGSGIHALRISFQVRMGAMALDRFVYCFTVMKDDVTLIDTGVAGSEKLIEEHLAAHGRDIAEVGRIILTHAHPDHLGAAKKIQDRTGCMLLIHAAEKAWAEDPALQNRERPVPGFADLVGGPVQVDHELTDGMRIGLGRGGHIRVMHTPGHSPGSSSFFLDDILFTGDAVPVPSDLPIYDDFSTSVDSLLRLRKIKAGTLCMSWAEPTADVTGSIEGGTNYLRRLDETLRKVREEHPGLDDAALTRRVLDEMGMGSAPAMPLVTRSLLSHGAGGKR